MPPLRSVLVLETDPSLRRLIALGLQHHGLHVVEANFLATIPPTAVSAVDLLVLDVDGGVTEQLVAVGNGAAT